VSQAVRRDRPQPWCPISIRDDSLNPMLGIHIAALQRFNLDDAVSDIDLLKAVELHAGGVSGRHSGRRRHAGSRR
jgi:hypothetical protein